MEPIAILSRVQKALPVRPFTGTLLLRTAVLWVLVRVAFAILALLLHLLYGYPPLRDAIDPSVVTVFGITILTVALGRIDMRRRREHVLLANLGVGQAAVAILMPIPPLLFETLMALVIPS
jgi:hypothetical protein